jgi:radical SAM superfamily enzyme YgiQ (UPF0313 family)
VLRAQHADVEVLAGSSLLAVHETPLDGHSCRGIAREGIEDTQMKTLLVYPPFHRLHGLKNRFFPLGLGYLAGALRAAGHEVAIYNGENYDEDEPLSQSRTQGDAFTHFQSYQDALDDPNHYVWQEAKRVIARYQPDVVGITTKSCMIPSAQMITGIAKAVLPNVTVIWGGPHASICPDETIGFDHVDFVARHEGEQTIVEFVEMLESGEQDWARIDGLVWKDRSQKVVHNKLRANLPDINAISFPDKAADLFPARYEPDHQGVMFTSRGCPWPCTFCDSRGVWTRQIRYRTPENIVQEMSHLYEEHGVRDFYFWDDTFTPYRKHAVRVFEAMIREFRDKGRPITWQATTRCDCVDEELAQMMKDSGCRLLTYGVETGSPRMMEILKKGITHEKVFHAQNVMRNVGIVWDAFFMIGFPDDTPETIEETMALIRVLECRGAGISIFTPYPGLEIYERAKKYNLIQEPIEWRYFSHHSPRNHFVKNISREDFRRIAGACLRECDQLNARRYRAEQIRYFTANPRAIPGKIGRVVKERLHSALLRAKHVAAGPRRSQSARQEPLPPPPPDFAHSPRRARAASVKQ